MLDVGSVVIMAGLPEVVEANMHLDTQPFFETFLVVFLIVRTDVLLHDCHLEVRPTPALTPS